MSKEGSGHSPELSTAGKSPSIVQHPNLALNSNVEGRFNGDKRSTCLPACMLGWLVKGDSCRKDVMEQQSAADEDVLFCTLCNAEVLTKVAPKVLLHV